MTLEELQVMDIKLWLAKEGVLYDGPESVMTENLLTCIKRHKRGLVTELIQCKIQEYPPDAERVDGKPYIGPSSKKLIDYYMNL